MEFDHEEKLGVPAEQLDDFVIQANCDRLVRTYCTTQGIYHMSNGLEAWKIPQ